MARASAIVESGTNVLLGYMIFCPACECGHAFWTERKDRPKWTFNGDLKLPTFKPSMLIQGVHDITDEEHAKIMRGEKVETRKKCCHSFVTDGKIQYLGDCTHKLMGQTVDLPDFFTDKE